MQLTNRGPAELSYPVSNERISTGLTRLDHMLSGGYHRGSNVLISGAPGTAKSTLAGLFAAAACARGDRTLYVSFDEGAAQIVRNLRSVNVKLEPFLRSGVLRMYSTRTRGPNVEDQFGALRLMVREFGPRCLVIDPLSALSTKHRVGRRGATVSRLSQSRRDHRRQHVVARWPQHRRGDGDGNFDDC
jgi:circadian clock protein KaiC